MNYGNEEENVDSEVVCEDSTGGINDSEFECESLENDADNEDLLACALSRASDLSPAIIVEPSENDIREDQLVSQFIADGCGCQLRCSQTFSEKHILETRLNFVSLSNTELDLVVLGQLNAFSNCSNQVSIVSRHQPTERKKKYSQYYHQGEKICRIFFRFLHTVGDMRLKNLMHHLSSFGPIPRVHGNTKRLPKHALSFLSIQNIVQFLLNYADQHAIFLPGRIPGDKSCDLKLLPSSLSKHEIWKTYADAASSTDNIHAAAYSTFCKIWRSVLPSILIMKPMTDLCFVCQQNSGAIMKAANRSDVEKSSTLKKAENHLYVVQLQRSFYKTTNDLCKKSVRDHFTSNEVFLPHAPNCNIPANSNDITVHYSFDYAQQVHFLSDPLQPGPNFFLTPRKCSIFGVHCEAIPRQIHFLTDESVDCGKGANTVVSQLHYFFEHHGFGEKEVHLHCDNCVGQNKNACMLQYLTWRCLTNRHEKITLSFLIVGHTKFAPDWCFGLLKRKFREKKKSGMFEGYCTNRQ